MESGRTRLLQAATSLLAQRPDREPSTREIYEAAGVGAPTLYHHFGDKDGLLNAAVQEAFTGYLARKHAVGATGDVIADFAAGWQMHVEFGVEHPALYTLMYSGTRRQSPAALTAETELRRAITRLSDVGLLRINVDEAVELTTAMAVGCVTRLIQTNGAPTDPVNGLTRRALLTELVGPETQLDASADAARLLISRLVAAPGPFTPPERALLTQWLTTLAAHLDATDDIKGTNGNPANLDHYV